MTHRSVLLAAAALVLGMAGPAAARHGPPGYGYAGYGYGGHGHGWHGHGWHGGSSYWRHDPHWQHYPRGHHHGYYNEYWRGHGPRFAPRAWYAPPPVYYGYPPAGVRFW